MESRRAFLKKSAAVSAAAGAELLLAPAAFAERRPKHVKPHRRRHQHKARPVPGHPAALDLTSYIDGEAVTREEVLMWEARRLEIVAQRMKTHLPDLAGDLDALFLRPQDSIAHVAQDRQTLLQAKLRAGEKAMRAVVASDLLLSGPAAALGAAEGTFAISTIQMTSNLGTAQGFVDWFNGTVATNDIAAMLQACPDHYVLDSPAARQQFVIEVTGGAVLASEFTLNYADPKPVPIPNDPSLPVRVGGHAKGAEGTVIGLAWHQFGNQPGGGFKAVPAIGFPASLPGWFITEHRWHLACEFSNWITAYVNDARLA
jgi:hypothetical protein